MIRPPLPLFPIVIAFLTLSAPVCAHSQALSPLPRHDPNKEATELPTPKAPPDVLIFTNGDQLTGKLERATEGNVVFKSDMAGELTVPYSKVKELHSGAEFVALHKGKPSQLAPLAAGIVNFAKDELTIQPRNAPVEHLPVAELGYLVDVPTYAKAVDHHAGALQGWNGSATAGLTLVRSTEKSTTFTAAANFARVIPVVSYLPSRNRTTVNVTETFGTDTTPVIPQTTPPSPEVTVQTSIFHADGERDQYISSRLFVLGDLSYDHNFSQGLQLQQVYGGGVGWTPLKDEKQELDIRGDVHYEKQQFLPSAATTNATTGAPVDNLNLIGSTFQENYRRTLPRSFLLTEWANILPAWNDPHAYSANAYIGLTMPLFKSLGATMAVTDNYLNNPSPGYRTDSVQILTGLTYTLK